MSETLRQRRTEPRPARVRCPLGGYAPCVDDLCHGGGRTLCGLEYGYDFCTHGNDPESCQEYPCDVERDDPMDDGRDEPWWDE